MQWGTPMILALRELKRKSYHESEASLKYPVRPY